MTFTLAHITDLHMGPMTYFGPRHWNAKRLLGTINWHRGRRAAHQMPVLEAIKQDMLRQAPDHIAVTGDLVNVGLPQEHVAALGWLNELGTPEQVTVVPGNHDIYTPLGDDEGAMRWAAFMAANSDGALYCADDRERFPFVRRFGKIALIGLNSAKPTRPFVAAGRLGSAQLQRLAATLEKTRRKGLMRVVLIHHPPLPGQAARLRGLEDGAALRDVLASHGAELIIHGHNHRNMLTWWRWRAGVAPIVGAPSASMGRRHHGEPLARYNLYRIDNEDLSAPIEMIGRGLGEPGGAIVELERRSLKPGELELELSSGGAAEPPN